MKHPLTIFVMSVVVFFMLFWGAQLLPGSAASGAVLVLATIAGVAVVRPGWNIKPAIATGYWALLFALLLVSAVMAAYLLRWFHMSVPYDTTALNVLTILPGIALVTCIEELLFRQVMFRWAGTGPGIRQSNSARDGGDFCVRALRASRDAHL